MLEKQKEWRTPKIEVINLEKYEGIITANARSGTGSCGVVCMMSCSWEIGSPCNGSCWND